MAGNQLEVRRNNIAKLKAQLKVDSVQEQFENALKDNSGPFVASVIDLYGSDTYLQECDPTAVVMECLKAATLKLPINKQLGFAYIVPYGGTPQFQLGYKGYIQLAMRTGKYKFLNAGVIHDGMKVSENLLTGETTVTGGANSDKVIGYFAHMELLNGFTKTVYLTTEKIEAHGKKFSKSYSKSSSPWKTNFEAMAKKTVVRLLLSKWGIMSIEMQDAIVRDVDAEVAEDINQNANKQIIDVQEAQTVDDKQPPAHNPETGELSDAEVDDMAANIADEMGPEY